METRLVVSTECPTCAAPIDFGEGATAIRCDFCSSNLLVTGRGQVLSYQVSPRIDGAAARSLVRFAGKIHRVGLPSLWFVPYYRFRAHDFRWEKGEPVDPDPFRYIPEGSAAYEALQAIGHRLPSQQVVLRDRYVEKNFLAWPDRTGPFPYSLGVRPTVVRLELYRKSVLQEQGRVLPPAVGPADALEHALRTSGTTRLLCRETVGRVLSVVYFPFWLVPGARDDVDTTVVIDAVASQILGDGPEIPSPGPAGEERTAGFRPLVCPNCGWDLPVRPDDVLFCCSRCETAWELDGTELERIPVRIVRPKGTTDLPGTTKLLPFWVGRARAGSATALIPAFRCRRLKILADLVVRLNQPEVEWETADGPWPDLEGGFYDRQDALRLARFVIEGPEGDELPEVSRVDELVWMPFEDRGYSLIDPFLGSAVPKNLVG